MMISKMKITTMMRRSYHLTTITRYDQFLNPLAIFVTYLLVLQPFVVPVLHFRGCLLTYCLFMFRLPHLYCSRAEICLSLISSSAGQYYTALPLNISLISSFAVPLVLCDSRALQLLSFVRLWALAHTIFKHNMSSHTLYTPSSFSSLFITFPPSYPIFLLLSAPISPYCFTIMSPPKDSSISTIPPLTSENYHFWADDIKSWLQLNGLWRLVS